MDWSDALVAAPIVLIIGAVLFKAGGWYHTLKHVLEHGHDAKKE